MQTLQVDDRKLSLNGIGTRTATRFLLTADIYVAALYLTERSSNAREILSSREPKQLKMQYSYSIGAADMRRGWEYAFRQNCPAKDCSALKAQIDAFLEQVVGVEPGDRYDYLFFADRVDIIRNDASQGAVSGRDFVELLLSTWIGDVPPTPAVRQGLLGL